MNIAVTINPEELAGCFRRNGTPKDNYFNYTLIFALYVLDWVISEEIDVDINVFLRAAHSGEIDRIRDFFRTIHNDDEEQLVYNSRSNNVYMSSDSSPGVYESLVGEVKCIHGNFPKFEAIAMHFLNGNDVFGKFASTMNDMFSDNRHLSALCTMLYNQIKKKGNYRITIYAIGGTRLRDDGKIAPITDRDDGYTFLSTEHCINSGLLEKVLDCLVAEKLITIDPASPQVLPAVREESSNNHCDSVKENLRKHPYIALFAIAAAALLAGGAIALTTYFHVGTSLMLAAGFIPFLNFVGGFQISLLLGVVTAATACAGVCVAVKERSECCKLECCDREPANECDYTK
jgi:hypothetical protein